MPGHCPHPLRQGPGAQPRPARLEAARDAPLVHLRTCLTPKVPRDVSRWRGH